MLELELNPTLHESRDQKFNHQTILNLVEFATWTDLNSHHPFPHHHTSDYQITGKLLWYKDDFALGS